MENNLATASSSTVYIVHLKQKNNTRTVTLASALILLIALITALARAIYLSQNIVIAAAAVLMLLAVYWLAGALRKRPPVPGLNVAIAITAVYWFLQGSGLDIFIGATLAATFWFEIALKKPQLAKISPTGVVLQSAFTKTFAWQQLANVIIKDGLLTVDTKTNKLYQKEAAEDFTPQQEAEINDFCRLQLNA